MANEKVKDKKFDSKDLIRKCKCKNEFMDKHYGQQLRVTNPTRKKNGDGVYFRCCSCEALVS